MAFFNDYIPYLVNFNMQALQTLIERIATKNHIPHVVLAIESMDKSFYWASAIGKALPDGTPMKPDTPFFIASIDKIFIATVILMLHERKALSIDDPITNYLPSEMTNGLHRLRGVDYTPLITIRNLLGHTSGLPDYLEDYPKGEPSLIERIFEGEDQEIPIETMLNIVKEQLTPHFPPQARNAPKQKIRYSDTNFQLLMAIIEAVCNKPFHIVVYEMIFSNLKLPHTWFAGYSQPSEPTNMPASIWVGENHIEQPRLLRSLNSIYSTTSDLITFLRALLRAELFINKGTLDLMQEKWNKFGIPLDKAGLRSPGWPIEYAFGLKRFQLPAIFAPFSPIPAVIGHTGSTGTWLFYCPKLDVFIAGAINQATAVAIPFKLVSKVLRILVKDR